MRSAAVLVLALTLAGCGGGRHHRAPRPSPGATATPRPPTDRERIGTLLAHRARHIGARHRALGLRHVHYAVDAIALHGRRARVRGRLSYAIRGVEGDFGAPRSFIVVKRHGQWRFDRAVGTRDADPWEVDDYVRATTPHFVVLTPHDIPAPSTALEAGYARIREVLRHSHLRARYLAVVARDSDHARRLTRVIQGIENLTALTDTQLGSGRRIASQRLIVVQSLFGAMTADDQQTVITHELTHAALAPLATGRTPAWLIEGTALYVSDDDRRAEYASLSTVPTLAGLSAPEAIARLSGDQQRAAYATSSAIAFLIADRYGGDALLSLYRAFAKPGPRRGSAAYDDRVLRRVLGTGIDALQRSLR